MPLVLQAHPNAIDQIYTNAYHEQNQNNIEHGEPGSFISWIKHRLLFLWPIGGLQHLLNLTFPIFRFEPVTSGFRQQIGRAHV